MRYVCIKTIAEQIRLLINVTDEIGLFILLVCSGYSPVNYTQYVYIYTNQTGS